jgi:4'-phosphopantetheinyl transferase
LRRTLSHYANIAPADWSFTGEHGVRPELIGNCTFTNLRFSLTHSTGIVACAVARTHPIGLDAESICLADSPMALAEEFFAEEEVTFLRELPRDELSRAFLQIWTLKEAYLKSLGTGLALALRSFTVSINPPAVEPRETSSTTWVAASRWISDEHVVSVTVPRGNGECSFKWNICHEPSL